MLSEKAYKILEILDHEEIAMGKIKSMGKEIKKDHELALELWSTAKYYPRLLSALILDKKELSNELIESMMADLSSNSEKDALRISEWILANQLLKSKKTITLLESYQYHEMPMLRRLFWYYQARLRWTGNTDFDNTKQLVETIESELEKEVPIVQWAMNFTAGWIGVYEKEYRERCIKLGKDIGLYSDEVAPKGCAPNYLPEFIRIKTERELSK